VDGPLTRRLPVVRRRRISAPSTWLASVGALLVLAVLATLTVGWVRSSSDASGDLPVRNDDGTVGPIVALGDSLTADLWETDATGARLYESWYVRALAAEPRLESAFTAGMTGDTTTDMLARFPEDVAAWSPRVVVILGGTNDLAAGRTTVEVLGTLGRLVEKVRDLGATPVLGTVPPRTDGDYAEGVADLNAAIRAAGEDSGITVIDFFSVLTDGDDGWQKGFTEDGVHPTAAAAEAMAELAVETLLGE
jgi:lysophospholipase L1-like esterase